MVSDDLVREVQEAVRRSVEKERDRPPVVYQWEGTWEKWQEVGDGLDVTAVKVWLTVDEEAIVFRDDEVYSRRDMLRSRWPKVVHWYMLTNRGLSIAGSEIHFD